MKQKNELAFAGMICSIIGFLGVTALSGIILSIFGLKKSKDLDGLGKKEAIIGIVLGIIFTIIFIPAVIFLDKKSLEEVNSKEKYKDVSTSTNKKGKETKNKEENTSQKEPQDRFSYTIEKQYNTTFAYYVEGTVTNNRDMTDSYIAIEFTCYDSEGNNLGRAFDNNTNLIGHETWKYKAMLISNNDKVDHCDFYKIY